MCSGQIHLVQPLHAGMKSDCFSVVRQAAAESKLLTVSQPMLQSTNAQLPVQTEVCTNQTILNFSTQKTETSLTSAKSSQIICSYQNLHPTKKQKKQFSFTEFEVAGVLGAIQGVRGHHQFIAHALTCRQLRVAHQSLNCISLECVSKLCIYLKEPHDHTF